jgi:hypothetical protein
MLGMLGNMELGEGRRGKKEEGRMIEGSRRGGGGMNTGMWKGREGGAEG